MSADAAVVDILTGEIMEMHGSLAANEAIIERGMQSFVEVGNALARIRDGREYRPQYDTFEAYCQERWDWGRNHVNKQIAAAALVSSLGTTVPKPTTERQARELRNLPAETAADVMRKAASAGALTAKSIARAREQIVGPPVAQSKPLTSAQRAALTKLTTSGESPRQGQPGSRAMRVEQIRAMADSGRTSEQIASEIGLISRYVRKLAREEDITIQADRVLRGHRHRASSTKIIECTLAELEALCVGLKQVDYAEVDLTLLPDWESSLTTSLHVLQQTQRELRNVR